MNNYSIATSDAEYVTAYNTGCISTTADVNKAKRMTEQEAKEMLRPIKARIDSGAQVFRNPACK